MSTLRFLTAGESHGKALVGILEGIPAGLDVEADAIQRQLLRRKLGHGRGARQKMEDDAVQILSGVRHGRSLGSPIALLIENKDWKNWQSIMRPEPVAGEVPRKLEVPRPGHADYAGGLKYHHSDMRNVLERASARETTIRVALAAVARIFLETCSIRIGSRVTRIGEVEDKSALGVPAGDLNARTDASPVRCLGEEADERMRAAIDAAKKAGDTLGGVFEVVAEGVPLGLGSHVQWDRRLEGRIAQAFMSLNAIKGVEIGMGFEAARTLGSRVHDELLPAARKGRAVHATNRSGGIDGGITTGNPIVVRVAMKPIATLMNALRSVRLATGEADSAHVERSDVCAVPAAAVIGEALLALTLADVVLDKFGGDSMDEILPRLRDWSDETRPG